MANRQPLSAGQRRIFRATTAASALLVVIGEVLQWATGDILLSVPFSIAVAGLLLFGYVQFRQLPAATQGNYLHIPDDADIISADQFAERYAELMDQADTA